MNMKQKSFPLKHNERNEGTVEQLRSVVRSVSEDHFCFLFFLIGFLFTWTERELAVILQISVSDKTKQSYDF